MLTEQAKSGIPELKFKAGTLILDGFAHNVTDVSPHLLWDSRTRQWRAPALAYRQIMVALKEFGAVRDMARNYDRIGMVPELEIVPRDHQSRALSAWKAEGSRGVVVLPTGAGKTILAVMAIHYLARPTLVVVPTIDLLHQWCTVIRKHLGVDPGVLGGGYHSIKDITVSTYDSAAIHIEKIGDRFGFLIADECHHLPAPHYRAIGLGCIAPFRLGLTATIERSDGKESIVYDYIGPKVYEANIGDMVDDVLARYEVVNIEIPLTQEELAEYTKTRSVYTNFVRQQGIDFSAPNGWNQFVILSSRSPMGRDAMRAYLAQKRLAQAATGKMQVVWDLLRKHAGERILIFTDDNALAYRIGTQMILPVLTHHTKLSERRKMLDMFREGSIDVIVTSKVLNEGVDVPEATVAIVVSGSAGVREHVQRLGRILRHKPGKRARLYELVARGTNEKYVNQRRRQHHAYQRPSQFHR